MFSTPRRRRIGWSLLYFCVALFVLAVVAIVAQTQQTLDQVRATQLEGTPLGKQLKVSSDRILDCTDATGDCFKENQRRTAQTVGDINKVIVLAAACSVGLEQGMTVEQRQIAIQECVIERLAVQGAKP